ncbi:MAG: segregation/condensation protein A [Ignavibacteriales bacterium]|nr:segregation/condensation protein A [Ignavibacteriales bacterium]
MYKIKLQQFEGPLDLLLFFIRRHEIDIYDIPIAMITKEFLEYVQLMKQLDLTVASDFILMAATLMQIKVRMLLPREIDEKGEEVDPRADLVAALLEYRKYKEMAEELSYFESEQRKRNFRGNFDSDYKDESVDLKTLMKNVTIYDLMRCFKAALDKLPPIAVHQIKKVNITIEEQMEFIFDKLNKKDELHFLEIVEEMKEKIRIIVTIIALLELIKMGRIGLKESERFNDFLIYSTNNG